MGQKSGLETSYFKPTITDLLEGNDKVIGYSSLIDVLTINEENRLRQKVKELSLREKDDIAVLKSQVNKLTAMLGNLIMEKGAKIEQPSKTDVETVQYMVFCKIRNEKKY